MKSRGTKTKSAMTDDQARLSVTRIVRSLLLSLFAMSFRLFAGPTHHTIVYKCIYPDGTVKYTNRSCPVGTTGTELFTYSGKSFSEKAKDPTAQPATEISPERLHNVEEQALSYLRNHCRFQLNSHNARLLGGYARFYAGKSDLSPSEAVAQAAADALNNWTLESVDNCR